MKFEEIITNQDILKVIEENNYTNPTEIQEKIIPIIKQGYDVLGQSQTGTGKTLAFAVSILDKIKPNKKVQTLILAPTRELAIQISKEIENLGKYTNIKTTCVYGSSSIQEQIKKLHMGSEIVIGTPGRVKDLMKRKVLNLNTIDFFVLDEADEMLSMGFKEEIEFIFENTNKDKQVLLFSATMPKTISSIAKKYMNKDYKSVSIKSIVKTADNIEQNYYVVNDNTKVEAMCRVMDYYNPTKAIIFCRTKRNVDEVYDKLVAKGYSIDKIHGDIVQEQRIASLELFKKGVFNYLIATDVAARGIHVDDVELVVNFNLPESTEEYVHRIGRTGRAGNSGVAITFIKNKDEKIIKDIEDEIHASITKCQIPTIDQILPNRVSNVIKYVDNLKGENVLMFNEYLNTLTNEQLLNITSNLLNEKLKNSLGSDFDINVKEVKEKTRKPNEDSVRIFLTIGKLDKIDKRDLLSYIEKKSKVKNGTCSGVEILTKFTFMNVKKDSYQKIFDAVNNTKYKNRIIRIEKAKK